MFVCIVCVVCEIVCEIMCVVVFGCVSGFVWLCGVLYVVEWCCVVLCEVL